MKDDYTIIWSGSSKQPIPGISGEGWSQKYKPEVGAVAREFLSRRDMATARHVIPADTGIGIGSVRALPTPKAFCRGCGKLYPLRLLTKTLKLCSTCRPGRQRAVRYAA